MLICEQEPYSQFSRRREGGIRLLNITLNWSNITSTVITYPYSVQVVIFVVFVLTVSHVFPNLRLVVLANKNEDLDFNTRGLLWEPLGIANIQHHVKRSLLEEWDNLSVYVFE
jgi:hypothetical protein